MWRQSAIIVAKLLKGIKPSDLPVEQPTKFELVVNLRTAKSLGLTIPVRVAAGADDPHAEGDAEFTDIEPDSAGAHDARSLTFQ
jgi:hypothetical protein